MTGRILVVDDNKGILTAIKMLLGSVFQQIEILSSPKTLISTMREFKPDVILLDMNFSSGINTGNEGIFWLNEIRKVNTIVSVVLFTAYADIDLAVRAIKEGANDFVVKPWDNAKLLATIQSAYNLSKSRNEVKQLREIKREFKSSSDMYWGTSPAMSSLYDMCKKVASTDANILITGENGTGKEVLAREIHAMSSRAEEPLVCVDMGAITESLFESELFGHAKGAFTDAKADRAGKFEVAGGGTLFLDEIGNLPLHLQAKLLSAIQTRTITRVGSNSSIPIDIRLICATNCNLPQMVKQGTFREDLLYRINTIELEIAALRNRKEDIRPLTEIFVSKYTSKYGKHGLTLSDDAADKLQEYIWKGNVRELQHTVEKAVIICDGKTLTADDFLINISSATSNEMHADSNATLDELECNAIRLAMDKNRGNLSAIASQLGITRQTLYNKMKKYNI